MRQWIVWCECRNSIHDIYVGMMSIFRHCIIVAMVVRPAITSSFSFKLQHRHRAIISHHHFIAGSITTLPPSSRTSRHRQGTHSHVPFLTTHHHDAVINNGMAEKNGFAQTATSYIGMMRPITIIQAVGAFLVGRLVILTSVASSRPSIIQELPNLLTASLSIYLSYGAGMAMNDCADVGIDSMHEDKQSRSVASETISLRNASLFCLALSILSIVFSFIARVSCKGSNVFPLWNLVNLMIMTTYALGLQRLFLVKNLLCGYLAISPLIGASLLGGGTSMLGGDVVGKLYKLAAIGFPLQVAREILKDVEDVKVDKGTKMTLPIVVGERNSKWIAYSLVYAVNIVMILSPYYWRMFKSTPNVYAISVAIGTPMCIWASVIPLSDGQQMLKKSVYVLLLGMILALLNQAR